MSTTRPSSSYWIFAFKLRETHRERGWGRENETPCRRAFFSCVNRTGIVSPSLIFYHQEARSGKQFWLVYNGLYDMGYLRLCLQCIESRLDWAMVARRSFMGIIRADMSVHRSWLLLTDVRYSEYFFSFECICERLLTSSLLQQSEVNQILRLSPSQFRPIPYTGCA